MAITLRAANSANAATGSTVAVTMPTGSAAGDICFIVLRVGTSGLTISQTAGSTWTIQFQGNNAGANYTYAFASIVLPSGFTAPTFSWGSSATNMYAVIGFFSSTGAALSVDAWNSAVVNTSATSNTVTPNAVTTAGSGETSVILTSARASTTSTGTDTGTFTPSTNWTTPASGSFFFSQNTLNNRFVATDYQLGVSGTVTPGSESLTDSGSHVYTFVVAHVLAKEAVTAVAGSVQPLATVPIPRRRLARGMWGGVKGQAFVFVPAPVQEYRLAPRRVLARGVWRGISGQAFVFVPAPPRLPPVPRRVLARAVWRGSAPFLGFVAVPASRQPPYLPPRRVLARVAWRGSAPFGGFAAVPAPRQLPVFPRRRLARAYVQFTPVRTVNAAVVVVVHGQVPQVVDDKPHLKKLLLLVR